MYLRNTHNTRLFLRAWEFYIKQRMKKKKKFTDQHELNHLLQDTLLAKLPKEYASLTSTLKATTFDWDEFPNGQNYFLQRGIGKGVINSSCKSKVCESLIWKELSPEEKKRKVLDKNLYLVHHNFAKTNDLKISRAKDFGLWLELGPEIWQ